MVREFSDCAYVLDFLLSLIAQFTFIAALLGLDDVFVKLDNSDQSDQSQTFENLRDLAVGDRLCVHHASDCVYAKVDGLFADQ